MYAAEMSRRTPYRAMIAFPLRVWDPVVGWLTLYQRAGTVPIDVGSGTVIAARITDLLLGAGRLTEHRVERGRRWLEGPAARRRAQVRRAQGITMQLNRIGSSDALAVLRARAYGAGELLDDLAEDIVAGRVPVPTLGWDP